MQAELMSRFLRPCIRALSGYTPGEQPRSEEPYLKLNTNENPYPPSPRVLEALRQALTGERLRRYPDPLGTQFRQAAARLHGTVPEAILIGNGSDDILTIVTRAFVPEGGVVVSPTPSYLLYQTLAEIQGARFVAIPYTADWQLPRPWPMPQAHLTFIANPNSPSGTVVPLAQLAELADCLSGPLVIDEAYVDFADSDARPLLSRPHVLLTRSLSKSYALAGIRFGYAIADPEVVQHLLKVKDSYNCDALSLIAATAALEDQDYLQQVRRRIRATRERLTEALRQLGFVVCPSQANFVWCQRQDRPVQPLYEALKRRRILVRYMNYAGYGDGLRITVGTEEEVERLLDELRRLL
jgi:histidinol-phosphate aminotransferase